MFTFQGQLEVPLLWDPPEAGLPSEPTAGRHTVHGHEAAAHTPEAQVRDTSHAAGTCSPRPRVLPQCPPNMTGKTRHSMSLLLCLLCVWTDTQ